VHFQVSCFETKLFLNIIIKIRPIESLMSMILLIKIRPVESLMSVTVLIKRPVESLLSMNYAIPLEYCFVYVYIKILTFLYDHLGVLMIDYR